MSINTGVGDVTPFTDGEVAVYDNPMGFELYAEGPLHIFRAAGMISIAFYSPRSSPDGKVFRTIVGRLTLPMAGANVLASDLMDFLDKTSVASRGPLGPSIPSV